GERVDDGGFHVWGIFRSTWRGRAAPRKGQPVSPIPQGWHKRIRFGTLRPFLGGLMYRQLDVERILATAQSLRQRIDERFPGSGLGRVAAELVETARDGGRRLHRLSQPDWG